MNTQDDFNRAFEVLQRLLDAGADASKLDSAGSPALRRAMLDAKQVMSEPPRPELMADLGRVFSALLDAGADPQWVDPRSQRPFLDDLEGTRLRALIP